MAQRYPVVEFYRNRKREWSWRLKASNGAVIATPGESFKRRGGTVKNLTRTKHVFCGLFNIAVVK